MNSKNFLKSFFNFLRDKFEKSLPIFNEDQNVLHQSNAFARTLTWGLISSSGFILCWLFLAYTDEVVMVRGKLEPIGEVKEVSIPEKGIVKEILVRTGDYVKRGQILIELDRDIHEQKLNSSINQLIQKRKQLSLKKREKIKSKSIANDQIKALSKRKNIEQEIADELEYLVLEGAVSKLQYLRQTQIISDLKNEINGIQMNIVKDDLIFDQEIEVINSEISALQANNVAADNLLKYKSLRSPVDGIVFDLKPTTKGYVAQSSEPIMKIVPFDDLEADIEIPSNKIGFVKVGMPVEISIDSFPSSDFGVLVGNVKKIGSDALPPSQLEQRTEYKYPATIELEDQIFALEDGSSLPLQVGMSLSANIKLRKVSYLQLLFSNFEKKRDALKRF